MACAGPSRHPPPLPLVPHAPASSGLGRSSVFCAREEHKEPCDNLKDIRAHFYDYRNDEGILRQSEFHEACNGVGIWCEELIDRLFKEFDEDGSGTIEPDEICDTLLRLLTGEQRTRLYKLCFNLYDADGSGEISLVELQMYRGERTEAKLGMTQYQKDTLIWLFKNSKFLDNSGSIDLAEFTLLFENEPRLVKAMFSIIMAEYARIRGIDTDVKSKQSSTTAPKGKGKDKAKASKKGK